MSDPMPCSCPGGPVTHGPCRRTVTQEDFLCDDCREMDCPTATAENVLTRREALWARRLYQHTRQVRDGEVPF